MYKYVLLISVLVLSACASKGSDGLNVNHKVWDNRYHNKRIAQNNFDLEIIRFTDARLPAGRVPLENPRVIYEYDPEDLLNGVNYRIPVLLDKNFDLTNVPEPIYKVEVDLLKLRTYISTGGLWEGKHGKYNIELETLITVREPNSAIIFQENYDIDLTDKRYAGNARSPSAKYDQQSMFNLTEAAIRQIAQKVAWRMRAAHNKRMKALASK